MANVIASNGNITAVGVVRGAKVRAASLADFEIGTTAATSTMDAEVRYGYAGSSIAWGGTATDGAVNRMATVTGSVNVTAPKPADGKTGDFILRFSVSASAEPTVTVNAPTGCSFGSTQYAISGDTIGTSGEYEMMIQLIPTATANTYDYIECVRKISS